MKCQYGVYNYLIKLRKRGVVVVGRNMSLQANKGEKWFPNLSEAQEWVRTHHVGKKPAKMAIRQYTHDYAVRRFNQLEEDVA